MQAKETDSYNILFCGDVVGRPGRLALQDFLLNTNIKEQADFIIVNAENASHGFGLTLKNHNDLSSLGIDILTSGNHIWDNRVTFPKGHPLQVCLIHGRDIGIFHDVFSFVITTNSLIYKYKLCNYILNCYEGRLVIQLRKLWYTKL